MRHGEIRWYRFVAPDKRRPVLVLTRNSALEFFNEVTIAPITTTIRNIPTEVRIGPAEGVARESAINLDHLQTVPRRRIGTVLGILGPALMADVRTALLFALGFRE